MSAPQDTQMSETHDRDKMIALLKSVAAPCEGDQDDHKWRTCRHCLAIEALHSDRIRRQLAAFVAEVER